MSAQTTYNFAPAPAFAGMPADDRHFSQVSTAVAQVAIPFGKGVCAGDLPASDVMIPKAEVATLTFSTDFITGNACTVTVNAVASATITFASTHAAMLAALAVAVDAITGVGCVVSTVADTLVITARNTQIVVSAVTTGGVSQPTSAAVYTCDRVFRGISRHKHKESIGGSVYNSGLNQFEITEPVNYFSAGMVWVPVTEAVAVDDTAFVVTNSGSFCKTATANLATGGKFKSATSGPGLAKLKINVI